MLDEPAVTFSLYVCSFLLDTVWGTSVITARSVGYDENTVDVPLRVILVVPPALDAKTVSRDSVVPEEV